MTGNLRSHVSIKRLLTHTFMPTPPLSLRFPPLLSYPCCHLLFPDAVECVASRFFNYWYCYQQECLPWLNGPSLILRQPLRVSMNPPTLPAQPLAP